MKNRFLIVLLCPFIFQSCVPLMQKVTDTDIRFAKQNYDLDSSAVVLSLSVAPYFSCVEGGSYMAVVSSIPEADLINCTEIDYSQSNVEEQIWRADYSWFSLSCLVYRPTELQVELSRNTSGMDRELTITVYRQKGDWYGHDTARIIQKAQ